LKFKHLKEYYDNPLFWADVDVSERSHILTHSTMLTYLQNMDVLSVSTFKDGVHEFQTIDTKTGYIKFSSNTQFPKIAKSLKARHVLIQDSGVSENIKDVCLNEIVVMEDKFGQAIFYLNNVPFITRKSFMNSRQATQGAPKQSNPVLKLFSSSNKRVVSRRRQLLLQDLLGFWDNNLASDNRYLWFCRGDAN